MTITAEQIDLWRSVQSETQNLEFKEAKTQYDNKKLYKYCVALANEGGGYLVLVSRIPPHERLLDRKRSTIRLLWLRRFLPRLASG